MIYITQLIYLKEGQEHAFNEFERIAIPLIQQYNGQLLLRLRSTEETTIESSIDVPYEVHFISFDSEADFDNFMQAPERTEFLYLKGQSLKTSILIKGKKI